MTCSSHHAQFCWHALLALVSLGGFRPFDSQGADLYVNGEQFSQSGGSNNYDRISCFNWGEYNFSGGFLQCTNLKLGDLGAGGKFTQSGGTLIASSIGLPGWFRYGNQGYGKFFLVGGVVHAGMMSIGNWAGCEQTDGAMNVDVLSLQGVVESTYSGEWAAHATYQLSGGMLFADSELLSLGRFIQDGGTNSIRGSLILGGDEHRGMGRVYGSVYRLNTGKLIASSIAVGNCSMFDCSGSTDSWNIRNDGSFSLGGWLIVRSNSQHFGSLTLLRGRSPDPNSIPPAPATITLGSDLVLKFADSSSEIWDTVTLLMISSWNGSLLGGGSTQLFFGTNSTGLTKSQIDQIRFQNPDGLPGGTYAATILSTGEVVPSIPALFWTVSDFKLVLRWSGPFTLETATNVEGPFASLPVAVSPYTNSLSGNSRFFRLAP